jgi:adenylate kinase
VRILILGPQGSGKGTQAKRIAEAYDIPHVATGEIFRAAIAEGSELGRQVQPYLDEGELVPDEPTIELIRERLQNEDGFVLDGFPRTLPQADALDAMLAEIGKPVDIVLLLQVRDDVATTRLLGRAAAEGRNDDAPEKIKTRLLSYHEETEPVVERYRVEGTLVPIPGERSVGEVADDIDAALAHVAVRSR